MNPFDEMDGIMHAYVLLLRQANLEKRVMESALQRIANGATDPQRQAMEALITIGKLRVRDEQIETPEMGIDAHFAEQRAVREQLRDVRERLFSRAVDGRAAALLEESLRDDLVKTERG
jgi:hypothetical protein